MIGQIAVDLVIGRTMETGIIEPLIAEGDAEFIFPVLVLFLIFFIQWIASKAKEVTELSTRRFESDRDEDEEPRPDLPPLRFPPPPPRPSPPPVYPTPSGGPGDELRRLLESLRESTSPVEPAPEAPQPKKKRNKQSPPPPPTVSAASPTLTPPLPPKKSTVAETKSKRTKSPFRVTPQAIRDAVVLKEILDPPKGLRDDW